MRLVCFLLLVTCVSAFKMSGSKEGFLKNRSSFGKVFASNGDADTVKSSGFGWDSHIATQTIPESLVKDIDGNESMRSKFEQMCRKSQVIFGCFLEIVGYY